MFRQIGKKVLPCLASLICILILASQVVYAQVTVNILAVNGTERPRLKKIKYPLPRELKLDDILDTAGLKIEYDVNAGQYTVIGEVDLAPKESKTFKVRIRDVWNIEEEHINQIKDQAEDSVKPFEDTEYYEGAQQRKQHLFERLDFILAQQTEVADNVEKRIDRYRIYITEIDDIRRNALSIDFWRGKEALTDYQNVVKFVVEVENPFEGKNRKIADKYYLPPEVKPEHFVETQGFDLRYDVVKSQTYLTKEIELKPREKKKYVFEIFDIWRVHAQDIQNLKDRANKSFKLLEKSKYKKTAVYLIKSIAEKLEAIEVSQKIERSIKEHISEYRVNVQLYESAKKDVESLEDLLNALRENLERSPLKNVLAKIKQLQDVADIAEVIFDNKPSVNNVTVIIISMISVVGLFMIVHYVKWGRQVKKYKKIEEDRADEE
ncbi:MAG: hypothetical protein K8S27_01490 [Candidatus Omnitrophica bacterium]|nr:hypothetical protein [Candidatus Omnitrophota bacterium]